MRKVSVLTVLLLPAFAAFGQKDIPSYGKIDKEDLAMTSCDFDPEADACVLIKVGETTFIAGGDNIYLQTSYRLRIKILKDKAKDQADIKIPFYSIDRLESIDGVSGETYNLDAGGNIVKSKVEKSNIYTKQLDKNLSEVAFSLPDVKKGSVIEYKYTKVSKNFANIDNWYFQDDIPTRYCQFYLAVPSVFVFTFHVNGNLPIDKKEGSGYEGINQTFTMKNIPGLRDEPYMSARRDYLEHIDFKLSAIRIQGEADRTYNSSWSSVNEHLLDHEDFGAQLHKNVPHTQELDAALARLKDSASRMQAVYEYVRSHMDWDGNETIWSDGIKSAWDKKKGSIADINLLLVNLLRDAGLDAHPILVSTRDHGRVNPFNPVLSQFNGVMAFVRIGDEKYVLNAADKYNPSWMIPYDVQYTPGFVVDKVLPGWETLINEGGRLKNIVILNGQVDSVGKLEGTATISTFGYGRNIRCKALKDGPNSFKDEYFTNAYRGLKVDSLNIQDVDNDSVPLKQTLDFTSQLNSSGQYTFITPNLFLGLEENPFVAEHRFTDINFGYRQSYMIVGSVGIPDGYTFETLPKNIRMIMEDTCITLERLMQADDNRINYRITLEFRRPIYYTTEYDDFREFYKKLYATLNEQIVIKKKS